MNYDIYFDFLLWYFIMFKAKLFKYSKKKLDSFFFLFETMSTVIDDKNYHSKIKEFGKKNIPNVHSKADLLKELKNLRIKIEKNKKYIRFCFDKFEFLIDTKIKDKEKLEKRKITYKNPEFWGPSLWGYLHLLSFVCNEKYDKTNNLKIIFANLPCRKCCNESKMYLRKNKLGKNVPFHIYLINFHNNVNKRLNKKSINDTKKKLIVNRCSILIKEFKK